MPVPYDWSKTPKTYLDRNDKIGLLIGSILAGGMGAASGQGGGDSALRGVAGAAAGFGGGANQLEDNYSRMIKDAMDRQQQEYSQQMLSDKFGFEKQRFEETKPLIQAKINALNQPRTKEFNTPGDLDTFLASKAGRFGLDYSNQADRMKMLQLFGNQSTGLAKQYNQWKPSLAPNIYNVVPGYQTAEGQPLTFNARKGIPKEAAPMQKTPSEADVKFERDYTSATSLIDALQNKFNENEKYLPQTATERITEYPSRMIGKSLQTNPNLASIEGLRTATLPKLIRSLGEVGTLTDMDIKRANEAMPTINDIKKVRDQKFNQLRDLISEIHSRGKRQENIIPNQVNKPQTNTINLPENIKTYSEAINHLTKQGMTPEQAMQWIKEND